jgi:hypothetical protein
MTHVLVILVHSSYDCFYCQSNLGYDSWAMILRLWLLGHDL